MSTQTFQGACYSQALDGERLFTQMEVIRDTMLVFAANEQWLTLAELHHMTHYPEASISAQIRNLRKGKFGWWVIDKRRRGEPRNGLYEYIIRPARPAKQEKLF